MKFTEKSCSEFIDVLASSDPVPGGGGASALVGSIGMALGNMVGGLTVGKEKYAEVEEEIKELMQREDSLQRELLNLCEKDAAVFAPLAAAYGMPHDTEKEKLSKANVMAVVLKEASEVPLEIMRRCCIGIDLHEEFAAKGSTLAISDVGVGVAFCKAALEGASLNLFINTKAMKDREYAEKANAEADKMLEEYIPKADKVYESVIKRLR